MNILSNFVFGLIVFITPLFSVSAPPFPYEVKQPDGSKIPIRMFGDEYYNWMETEDGYVVDFVEDDSRLGWYYSDLDSEGKFYATQIQVIYPAPANLIIPKKLREISPKIRNIKHSTYNPSNMQNLHLDRSSTPSILKPLVFLVDFHDRTDRIYSKENFQHLLFDTNLNGQSVDIHSTYNMSVKDYYYEISNEQLVISGNSESIMDWTQVTEQYSYYVDSVQGTGSGSNGVSHSAASLVVEIAMELESEIDFSDFDGNDDGDVDVIILIVEGTGNGSLNQFWPHMTYLPPVTITNAGFEFSGDSFLEFHEVKIKKYIVIPEQSHFNNYGALPNYVHPIGTICHEIGHVLGLPDLYDTINKQVPGIGEWGLMGSGSWQGQTSPAYMSAWSRFRLGFFEPLIIENVINVEEILLPAETGGMKYSAMILPMDSNIPQEYLILENRQKTGSDKYLEKSGLLVWHIDETITGMYPAINSVNVNEDFYGVNLLQADGEDDLYHINSGADITDPFPGDLGKTEISGSTNPNTRTYSYDRDGDGSIEFGSNSGIEIKNIVEHVDSSITFTVTNPNQNGQVLGYDEGGYNGYTIPDNFDNIQWAGIRIIAPDTALLAGIQTVFPPSYWIDVNEIPWNVTDYNLNIWKGWSNNQPEELLYRYDGNVQWRPSVFRDGGWAHISLVEQGIVWNMDETYYVEINFNGTGGVYPLDKGVYSNSISDNMSYYRGAPNAQCQPLNTIIHDADWNIRTVMSGEDDLESLSIDLPQLPNRNRIYSNYPNPFNPSTVFPISLSKPTDVNLKIFDILGRIIKEMDYGILDVGQHEFLIQLIDMSSGIYFYQFTISGVQQPPMKMALIK